MTIQAGTAPATRNTRPARGPGVRLAGLLDGIAAWAERRRQRFALAALDDNLLRDIGLSRADVESEIEKPFWRD